MRTSESIENISKALVAFEAEMEGVSKGAENPFFHSKYADLPSILQAIKPLLKKNKLAIVQGIINVGDSAGIVNVETRLIHEGGEWIEIDTPIYLQKFDPQACGSAITYGRRYSIQSLLSLSAEDSDAEDAMMRPTATKNAKQTTHNVSKVDPIPNQDLF